MKFADATTRISYEVVFKSQHVHIKHADWNYRGCGIAALSAVMDYWHDVSITNKTTDPETLLDKALAQGAYRENIGWSHSGLALLACSYGYNSFNKNIALQSPTPATQNEAFDQLIVHLNDGPVIASVFPQFNPTRGGGHLVIITGWDCIHIFINDPDEPDEIKGRKQISREQFMKSFKQRFVVIQPSNFSK